MTSEDPDRQSAGIESATDFARVDDGFERLWTPHRMAYIEGTRPTAEAGEGCPFCAAPQRTDADGLIVARGELCYVVMNLFPYNPGHLLICPYRHVPLYVDLTDAETVDIARMVLIGQVNPQLVSSINVHGPIAVGVSGEDAGLIKATAREPINRPDTYERFPRPHRKLSCEQQPTHT